MSRCLSCNRNLSDFESTRKYEDGTYVDMCKSCFGSSDMENVITIERADLACEYTEPSDSDGYDITGPNDESLFQTAKEYEY